MSLFEILGACQKLLLAIFLGVRIFRVFEILENLPYLASFKAIGLVVLGKKSFECFLSYMVMVAILAM